MSTGVMIAAPAPVRVASPPPVMGNRLVQRQCACGGTPGIDGECAECRKKRLERSDGGMPQTKLVLSEPGDPYEREADRVADEVMRSAPPSLRPGGADEELVQTKALGLTVTPLVQRQATSGNEDEEEEIVQTESLTESALAIDPDVEGRLRSIRSGGEPLSRDLADFFGSRFGYDFSRVRVRSDSAAGEVATRIRARAFALGDTVAFAPGQFAPHSADGRRLIAHELTHVVQQNPGRSRYLAAPARFVRAPARRAPDGVLTVRRNGTSFPVVGTIQFFDAAGESVVEVSVRQDPAIAPPPGIYSMKLASASGRTLRFVAKLPTGAEYPVTLDKLPSDAVTKKMKSASKTLFVVHGKARAKPKDEEEAKEKEETEKKKPPEPTGPAGGEKKDAPEVPPPPSEGPTGEERKDAPKTGPGEGEIKQEGGGEGERKEGEEPTGDTSERKEPGDPGGSGESARSGSKYGWLGLIDLPPWVVKALEKAFETLGGAEEYLALRDLLENLQELDGHTAALGEALSSPEKLLEIILGVEDASVSGPIDKLGAWVLSAPPERKKGKGKSAKGLAGVTKKVVGLLTKVRRTLRPVFATRNSFQEILGLASAAVTAPGAEALLEIAGDPTNAPDAVKKQVGELAEGIAKSLHAEMERVQKLFAIPTEAIAESEFVTHAELAVAVTRAAGKMVPKHVRPFVWAAEKIGLLDVVGENLVSELIPKAVLDALNDQLRKVLAEEVLGPLSKEVGPKLGEIVEKAGALLDTAVREVLEEVLIQPSADGSGDPGDADEGRVRELMGRSRAEPLAPAVRREMHARTGVDFGRVRVHRDEPAAEASRMLRAHAFTRGSDVFFSPGHYAPGTAEGRHLLAHELTHVAQQENGAAAGLIQRAAIDLAKKYVEKARAKVKSGAQVAFTPNPATAKKAAASLKALDRILGQKVVSDTNPKLPDGYLYVHEFALAKKPKKGTKAPQRPIKGIRREAGFILYLPPLRIDKNNRIALDLESRFDPNAGARRALRKALGCKPTEQAHHVVPLQLQNHPVVQVAVNSKKWNLNGKDNGECLSVTYHYGSHPVYTETVRQALDDIDADHKSSTDWNVIKADFLALIATLKKGLRARTYKMR